MSYRFSRNIIGIQDINLQPLLTNTQLDFLLDVADNAYIRLYDSYHCLTDNVKEINGNKPDKNNKIELPIFYYNWYDQQLDVFFYGDTKDRFSLNCPETMESSSVVNNNYNDKTGFTMVSLFFETLDYMHSYYLTIDILDNGEKTDEIKLTHPNLLESHPSHASYIVGNYNENGLSVLDRLELLEKNNNNGARFCYCFYDLVDYSVQVFIEGDTKNENIDIDLRTTHDNKKYPLSYSKYDPIANFTMYQFVTYEIDTDTRIADFDIIVTEKIQGNTLSVIYKTNLWGCPLISTDG